MMQGDQYIIPFELKSADGEKITADIVKEVEVFVGCIRKTLTDGGVSYDRDGGVFNIHITQKETFLLSGDVEIQARCLFASGDVVGVSLGTVVLEKSASKVVLE